MKIAILPMQLSKITSFRF